jgi:hypothetical protein
MAGWIATSRHAFMGPDLRISVDQPFQARRSGTGNVRPNSRIPLIFSAAFQRHIGPRGPGINRFAADPNAGQCMPSWLGATTDPPDYARQNKINGCKVASSIRSGYWTCSPVRSCLGLLNCNALLPKRCQLQGAVNERRMLQLTMKIMYMVQAVYCAL